ncbi:hypothetical protein ONO12_28450, partial [Salmonella enterica subsp. enterica serovar Montevideo]|nr:hypothetical protein [Salmonella enterica subsp. enterica serovar Montevideo]
PEHLRPFLSEAPALPGVYIFHSESDTLPLYIGKSVNIRSRVLRYAHGPDRPLKVTWPGPRNGSMAEITASPRIRQDTSTLLT